MFEALDGFRYNSVPNAWRSIFNFLKTCHSRQGSFVEGLNFVGVTLYVMLYHSITPRLPYMGVRDEQ